MSKPSTYDERGDRLGVTDAGGTLIGELQAWIDNETWNPLPLPSDIDHCWQLLLDEPGHGLACARANDRNIDPIAASHLAPLNNVPAESAAEGEGRFRPIRHLGAGGFGVVLHAYDTRLHRNVAIKMMRPSLGIHPRLVQRFLREARAVASLQHPGIVQVFETGAIAGQPCIVGELVDGPNLADFLKARGSALAPRQAAWVVQQVATAVHFAHSRGILHRDLKPSNILLAAAPPAETEGLGYRPRLTDFGLAKRFDGWEGDHADLTLDVGTLGTLRYMSPEQASGRLEDVAITSDVFTLGVILYQLISGKLPFTASLDYQVAEQICRVEATRPRKLNPSIPRDLEAIACKCLHKQPDDRYSSAKALVDDLEKFLGGLPVLATQPSMLQAVRYWIKVYPRKVAATGLVVASVLIACVSSSIAWWKERYEHERAESSLKLSERLIETAFFPMAEKLNSGAAITYDDHKSILLNVLKFHQEHAQQDPNDPKLLHRLSVAQHFVANGFGRLEQYDQAEKHRDECLRILQELLVRDPANRRTYLYQSFMAHMLIASERHRSELKVQNELKSRELEIAAGILESLLKEEPENVDYADAYNELRVQIANHSRISPVKSRGLVEATVASSLQLWRDHPSRPLLAKPAVVGYVTLADLDLAEGRAEDALRNVVLGRDAFREAFGPITMDDWTHIRTMEIFVRHVRALLMLNRLEEALKVCAQGLEEADQILARRPDQRVVAGRKLALLIFQCNTFTKTGNLLLADQAAAHVSSFEIALGIDSPEVEYARLVTSSD